VWLALRRWTLILVLVHTTRVLADAPAKEDASTQQSPSTCATHSTQPQPLFYLHLHPPAVPAVSITRRNYDDDNAASDAILQAVIPQYPTRTRQASSLTSRSPILPANFSGNQPKTIRLYPLSNYTFGTKENQPEEDPSVLARLHRLQEHYEQHGMRRTCEGVLVCHEHSHPHILMLQIANAFFKLYLPLSLPALPTQPTTDHLLHVGPEITSITMKASSRDSRTDSTRGWRQWDPSSLARV